MQRKKSDVINLKEVLKMTLIGCWVAVCMQSAKHIADFFTVGVWNIFWQFVIGMIFLTVSVCVYGAILSRRKRMK